MAVFFDSVPTTQSRLLTFRCPNYKDSDPEKHFITIAWKAKDGKVQLIVENIAYKGKPLALTPDTIENYKGDTFPEGTMFSTCTCLPKKNDKLCYISTEITPASQIKTSRETLKAPSLKATKKISRDLKASTRLLVQLYDGVEALADAHEKAHGVYLQKFQDLQTKISSLENVLDKLSETAAMLGEKMEKTLEFLAPKKVVTEEPVRTTVEKLPETPIEAKETVEETEPLEKPKSETEKEIPAAPCPKVGDKAEATEAKVETADADQSKAIEQEEKALDPQLDQYVDNLRKFVHDAQANVLPSADEVEEIEESDVFMESSVVAQANGAIDDNLDKVLQADEDEDDEEEKPKSLGVTQIMEAAVLRAAVAKYEEDMEKEEESADKEPESST